MGEMPSAGDSAWQMQTKSPVDIAWWNSLTEGRSVMESRNDVVPSAWLTHPVYSSQTWIDNRDLRLERTLASSARYQEVVAQSVTIACGGLLQL